MPSYGGLGQGADVRSERQRHLQAVAAGVNIARPRPSATKRRRKRSR